MPTTHKVRVWDIEEYVGKRTTTYRVRWIVADKRQGETFATYKLAESFRSKLVAAMSNGEAFDTETGRPVSMGAARESVPWLDLACDFMDARWADWSPNHRKHTARSLMTVTVALLPPGRGRPEGKLLRKAIVTELNKSTRNAKRGVDIEHAAQWARRNSPMVRDLADPDVLRKVLQAIDFNLDGRRAAADTSRLRRVALGAALSYATERKLLGENPLIEIAAKKRKQTVQQVDPRSVVNPTQARMLIAAVPTIGKPGPPLKAFFGGMYYAALRPEEACNLSKSNLALPEKGWGTIYLERARPEVTAEWTDSGEANEERSLKHRDDDKGRDVPCPPELTELLHEHLSTFGTAPDGRLFRAPRGGRVTARSYGRTWDKVRRAVFTPEVVAGPLAKRPYDLRHAAVSTWLNGGVEPTRVAKWAGHSVRVLLEVYAKCLDGGEQAARNRVSRVLRGL